MYVKLFQDILYSTIWTEDSDARIVWITLLLLADRDGLVRSTAPGISNASKVASDRTREILARLESPDPDSRTPDNEGRRIKRVNGGYLILNYGRYRELQNAEQRRAQSCIRSKNYREKRRSASRAITSHHAALRGGDAELRQADADTKADAEQDPPLTPQGVRGCPEFDKFWDKYPKKTGKPKALKLWTELQPCIDDVLGALEWQSRSEQWMRENGRYIPNPLRYLEDRRWEDEPPALSEKSDLSEKGLASLQKRVDTLRDQFPHYSYDQAIRHVGTPDEVREHEQRQRAKHAQNRIPANKPTSVGEVLNTMGLSPHQETK